MNALSNIAATVSTASLDYSVFKKAMTNACRVVERKNTIPVLDTVLITATRKGVHVVGTDMDVYSTTFVPGDVSSDFVAIVDAHKLKSVMDKVKDAADINMVLDSGSLVVSIGKLNLTLTQDIPVDNFPADQDFRSSLKVSNTSFVLPSELLRKALSKVEFAISTEETRYYLNGVFLHPVEHTGLLAFVTTDGHRLGRYEIPMPAGAGAMDEKGVIIPRKTVVELLRLLKRKDCPADTLVTVTTKGVSFRIGEDEVLESKVIDGTFPDYQRVIPARNSKKLAVRSAPFIEGLKQASSILQKGAGVKVDLTPGRMILSCRDPEFGTASTELHVDHEDTLEIGFNAKYLLEILGQLDGGAMLELEDAGSPGIIKDGADDGVTYVLMPLRV